MSTHHESNHNHAEQHTSTDTIDPTAGEEVAEAAIEFKQRARKKTSLRRAASSSLNDDDNHNHDDTNHNDADADSDSQRLRLGFVAIASHLLLYLHMPPCSNSGFARTPQRDTGWHACHSAWTY
jgi:hypothetical protein